MFEKLLKVSCLNVQLDLPVGLGQVEIISKTWIISKTIRLETKSCRVLPLTYVTKYDTT